MFIQLAADCRTSTGIGWVTFDLSCERRRPEKATGSAGSSSELSQDIERAQFGRIRTDLRARFGQKWTVRFAALSNVAGSGSSGSSASSVALVAHADRFTAIRRHGRRRITNDCYRRIVRIFSRTASHIVGHRGQSIGAGRRRGDRRATPATSATSATSTTSTAPASASEQSKSESESAQQSDRSQQQRYVVRLAVVRRLLVHADLVGQAVLESAARRNATSHFRFRSVAAQLSTIRCNRRRRWRSCGQHKWIGYRNNTVRSGWIALSVSARHRSIRSSSRCSVFRTRYVHAFHRFKHEFLACCIPYFTKLVSFYLILFNWFFSHFSFSFIFASFSECFLPFKNCDSAQFSLDMAWPYRGDFDFLSFRSVFPLHSALVLYIVVLVLIRWSTDWLLWPTNTNYRFRLVSAADLQAYQLRSAQMSPSMMISPNSTGNPQHQVAEEAAKKREMRLLKNRYELWRPFDSITSKLIAFLFTIIFTNYFFLLVQSITRQRGSERM